ncbi:MAG: hypothetical protein CMJ30_02075 [Phycisphaerae bacterium]|nr:hypothetical protein [Phycisphaerae bacterium]
MSARCCILLIGVLLASCRSSVVSPGLACVITIPQDPITLRYGFDGFGRVGQTTDPGPIPCVRRLSKQDQLSLEAQIATLGLGAPPESVVLATPCPTGMVQVDLAANGRRWSHRLPQSQAAELLQFCERCTGQGGGAELPNARYAWEGDPWAIWRQGRPSD